MIKVFWCCGIDDRPPSAAIKSEQRFWTEVIEVPHFPTITNSCLRYPSELIDTYKHTNVPMSAKCHIFDFPGSHPSREVPFPSKLPFSGIHLSWDITFPVKSNFLGSHIKQTYECHNVPMSAKYQPRTDRDLKQC